MRVWSDIASTRGNRDFLILFSGALLYAAVDGATGTLGIYTGTYFWGLTSAQLQWFSLTIIGAVAAFASLGFVGRLFDKRTVLLASFALIVVFGMGVTSLRLLHLMPPNGSSLLLVLLIANETVRAGLGVFLGIMFVRCYRHHRCGTGHSPPVGGTVCGRPVLPGKARRAWDRGRRLPLQVEVQRPAHVDPRAVDQPSATWLARGRCVGAGPLRRPPWLLPTLTHNHAEKFGALTLLVSGTTEFIYVKLRLCLDTRVFIFAE